MRVLLIIAAFVAVTGTASVSQEDAEFQAWKIEFAKSYGSVEEETQRKSTWMANLKMIHEHNILADQGIKTYRLGLNQFSDMDNEEYRKVVLNGCLDSFNDTEDDQTIKYQPVPDSDLTLPESLDWRQQGYVTPVKNQKRCGSCWAFSAAGALEGQLYKKTKRLIPLSEQQLVDCSIHFGNKGCSGGLAIKAFTYAMVSGGVEAEKTYPYKARDGMCLFEKSISAVKCWGSVILPCGNEKTLQYVVATVGPIAVSVDAKFDTFKHYKSGVYNEPSCSSSHLNHAVLLVGYGKENEKEYWLVKNSWGTGWGEKGYIKMSRNKNNNCGTATRASYPLV